MVLFKPRLTFETVQLQPLFSKILPTHQHKWLHVVFAVVLLFVRFTSSYQIE